MKTKPNQSELEREAIDAVKDLESGTGIKVKSGLKAGGGAGGIGKGGGNQPLYGIST
ncbi:MAG: hypothetical protein ABMB14_16465 [Myxococcota bacterium]